jgi:hypothetical protein
MVKIHWSAKKTLPDKIQGDSYSFDISEFEYDNQIALSPTNVKGGRIKFKNYVCNENVIYCFLITIYNNEQCLCMLYPN